MLQVADVLGQDLGLVRIAHDLIGLLDQRLRADLAPRQMVQADLPELALVDRQGMLARRPGQLVGNRQHGIEALVAGDVQIRLHLGGLQLVRAGLDFDQRGPGPRPALHLQHAVRAHILIPVRERHLYVSRRAPAGAPSGPVMARPNSRTEFTTASSADTPRRSCSSGPLIPETGISRARSHAFSAVP